MKAVLSVDPGLATGVCFIVWSGLDGEEPVMKVTAELDEDDFAPQIREFMENWQNYDNFTVICERFVINAQTVRNSQAPYSLEQIGALKQICRDHGYPVSNIQFQAPVDAKNMFPNKALKTLGYWHVGGAGHALDAIRHALLALVRLYRWVPRALLADLENN
jgi:hypothetical protein